MTTTNNQPKRFVSFGEAAVMLLGAGFSVKVQFLRKPSGKAALLTADSQEVAYGYRDGTTWIFRTETVQDFIDAANLEWAQQERAATQDWYDA